MIKPAVLLVAALAVACSSSSASSNTASEAPVPTGPGVTVRAESLKFITVEPAPARGDAIHVHAPARVSFREGALAKIGSPVAGHVVDVHVKVGQSVKKGDRLVTLHSSDAAGASAELAAASIAVRAAHLDLDRQQRMLDRGVGVEADKVTAEMKVADAESREKSAKRLSSVLGASSGGSVVRSPIDGVVLSLRATPGASVAPETDALVEIGNPSALWVVADLFEGDIGLVGPGATAKIELASVPTPVEGRVLSVGRALDPNLRRCPAYIELTSDAGALRSGMYARVSIESKDQRALPVPASAILVKDQDRHIVFVATDATTFVPRDVQIGKPSGGHVPVFSGLEPGERIVTRGAILLDGAASRLL